MDSEYRLSPALTPGYRLDRYELLCPIAEGGMAEVWLARMLGKHGFERLVAVKTILPKYAAEPMFQKMFLDEAHIASGIEHANVAKTLDLGEQHGVLFIVMDLVDGDAMTKLLAAVSKRAAKMPHGIILRILADVCGGLHAAHELRNSDGVNLGVVHRDVSPQNILLTTRGVAKLIDFGIAKAKDRLSGETNAGLVKGKVKYMAPEQALGRPIDRRVDVWAVGAILYRTLAGRPPYIGANELETLHALTSGKPPPPLPPSVPHAIGAIALRALAHDRERRFATTADMQAAMEQAMVDVGAATTTYDVQELIADFMLDRAAARKQTFELALVAARERERMQVLLKPNEADSSSGILDVGSRVLPLGSAPSPVKSAHDDDGDLTIPFQPQIHGAFAPAPIVSPRDMTTELLTAPAQVRPRPWIGAGVVAGVAVFVVVVLVVIAATRGGTEAHAVATSSLAAWSKTLRLPESGVAAPPTASTDSSYALVASPAKSATALPTTVAAQPVVTVTPTTTVAAPPRAPPTTAPTTPKKPRPDVDGF